MALQATLSNGVATAETEKKRRKLVQLPDFFN
jgi:hypothetical protein